MPTSSRTAKRQTVRRTEEVQIWKPLQRVDEGIDPYNGTERDTSQGTKCDSP